MHAWFGRFVCSSWWKEFVSPPRIKLVIFQPCKSQPYEATSFLTHMHVLIVTACHQNVSILCQFLSLYDWFHHLIDFFPHLFSLNKRSRWMRRWFIFLLLGNKVPDITHLAQCCNCMQKTVKACFKWLAKQKVGGVKGKFTHKKNSSLVWVMSKCRALKITMTSLINLLDIL